MKLRLVRIGGGVGVLIPKAILTLFGKKLGDYIEIEFKEGK